METTVTAKPKGKRRPEPPKETETVSNLKKPENEGKDKIPRTFYLTPEAIKELKITAAMHDITQSEIIEQGFRLWQERNGHA